MGKSCLYLYVVLTAAACLSNHFGQPGLAVGCLLAAAVFVVRDEAVMAYNAARARLPESSPRPARDSR